MCLHSKDKVTVPIGSSAELFGIPCRHLVGWELMDAYYDKIRDAVLKGRNTITSSEEDIRKAKVYARRKQYEEELLFNAARRNSEGIQLEKQGRIDEAIDMYEENLREGYPALHSYERLMIIYRKRKEYAQELRVIQRSIEVLGRKYPDLINKYKIRQQKAQALLDKRV